MSDALKREHATGHAVERVTGHAVEPDGIVQATPPSPLAVTGTVTGTVTAVVAVLTVPALVAAAVASGQGA